MYNLSNKNQTALVKYKEVQQIITGANKQNDNQQLLATANTKRMAGCSESS